MPFFWIIVLYKDLDKIVSSALYINSRRSFRLRKELIIEDTGVKKRIRYGSRYR
jgi:hypothetical protein